MNRARFTFSQSSGEVNKILIVSEPEFSTIGVVCPGQSVVQSFKRAGVFPLVFVDCAVNGWWRRYLCRLEHLLRAGRRHHSEA